MNRFNRLLTACALAVSLVGAAHAADSAPAGPQDPLAGARAHIAAKEWSAAVTELRRVNDTGSADWNNLMGYSLRKSKTPDLAGSEKYYNQALRIDPTHRGALSYSGELYLMKNDLPTAEGRLATLGKACNMSCPEYADLKKSVENYKAGAQPGSRY